MYCNWMSKKNKKNNNKKKGIIKGDFLSVCGCQRDVLYRPRGPDVESIEEERP